MTATHLARLADAVLERRQALGMTQGDLASKGGPGVVTVGKIERSEIHRPQASTLRALDVALRWREGSAAGVLQGHEPQELTDDEQAPGAEIIAAIEREMALIPEARKHLVNQLGLLLRIQEGGASSHAATTTTPGAEPGPPSSKAAKARIDKHNEKTRTKNHR